MFTTENMQRKAHSALSSDCRFLLRLYKAKSRTEKAWTSQYVAHRYLEWGLGKLQNWMKLLKAAFLAFTAWALTFISTPDPKRYINVRSVNSLQYINAHLPLTTFFFGLLPLITSKFKYSAYHELLHITRGIHCSSLHKTSTALYV